jgi:hypothetical protein
VASKAASALDRLAQSFRSLGDRFVEFILVLRQLVRRDVHWINW